QSRLDAQLTDHQKVEAGLWKECEDLQRQLQERDDARQRAEEALGQTKNDLEARTAALHRTEEDLGRTRAALQQQLDECMAAQQRAEAALGEARARWQEQQEQSQREKEFWERLIQSSDDGVFAFDRAFRCTVCNPAMERLSNLDQGEALGRLAFEV